MSVEEVLAKVEEYRDEVAMVCSRLVQCPSAHPAGRTVECVEYIEEYFDQLGISTEIYQRNKIKPNIVVRIKGTSRNRILWVGHLDVVPEGNPENWTYPPYSGTITREGVIWGRGTSDMKGACAAAMVAARVLKEVEEVPNNVDFWFTADEEVGGVDGALWLAQEGLIQGDVCIIGDGSSGTPRTPAIDLGCKGWVRPIFRAQGKTAHGSRPFLGDNALDKLLKVVPYVKRIADFRLDVPPELEPVITSTINYMMNEAFTEDQKRAVKRLFHYPSVSLNILRGGVKTNVVPDYAEAYFDIRLTSGTNVERVIKKLADLVKEAGEPGVTGEYPTSSNIAGYYESPNTPFANQLATTVEKVTGVPPVFKLLTGGTDAVMIKRFLDVPCLGFGASIEGQSHAPDEHNSIDILKMGCKVYSTFPLIYRGK